MWRDILEVGWWESEVPKLDWSFKGDDWWWAAWPLWVHAYWWRRDLADSRVFFFFIFIFSGASLDTSACLPSCPGSAVNQKWLLWLNQAHISMECGARTLLQWSLGPGHTLHSTIWSFCDFSPQSQSNCLLGAQSVPSCFHLIIQIYCGLLFRLIKSRIT